MSIRKENSMIYAEVPLYGWGHNQFYSLIKGVA